MTLKLHRPAIAVFLVAWCTFADAQQVVFTPGQGFSGKSRGSGALRILGGKDRPYSVDNLGREQSDGSFRLDQTVTFEGKPAQKRSWILRQTEPLHYSGSLSDASGPVDGRTSGARLFLRYRVGGVLVMHQTLELRPDGKTIDNEGRITFLGMTVGSLHETISRTDP